MRVAEHRCDRCGVQLGSHRQLTLEAKSHHPVEIELCPLCESEFALWLGKVPWSGTAIAKIAEGGAVGDGYPTAERAREYLRTQASGDQLEEGP